MYKIAVLISGSGSNLQAIIDAVENKTINAKIEAVISDKPEAYGLERAKKSGIDTFIVDRKTAGDSLSGNILDIIKGKVDLIVLAGFLSVLKGDLIKEFEGRIVNIHPSLIPSFCGKGMYGIKVHERAIEYGVKYSGCTVHFVDDGTDTGPIIIQKVVPVQSCDTAHELQTRVLEQEHIALVEAVKALADGKVKRDGRKVEIV